MTCNNVHLEQDQRYFSLVLVEGAKGDFIRPKKLGEFSFPLNEVDSLCPNNGDATEYRCMISPNAELRSGDVTFVIRKRPVRADWILGLRADLEKGINEQIHAISRFNKEYDEKIHGRLTGHIQGMGGITLLHAAINLQRVDQVERLVALGVNPRERSDRGTAIGFAVNRLQTVSEKISFKASREGSDTDMEEQKELLGKYEQIVALLRGSMTSSVEETSSSASSSVVSSPVPPVGDVVEDDGLVVVKVEDSDTQSVKDKNPALAEQALIDTDGEDSSSSAEATPSDLDDCEDI